MPYPYEHRTHLGKLGETLVFKFNELAATGNSTHLFVADVPYGAYNVAIHVWYTGVTAAKSMTVAPFIDHAQSLVDTNYKMFAPGIAAITNAITNASSAGANGRVVKVVNDILGSGDILVCNHGLRVSVVCATKVGTIDLEVIASKRS